MTDYIKREDALELINKCISYTLPEAKVMDFRHGEINGLNWAGDIIEAMPSADVTPKWIPCKERLPEPTQEVLVTGINGCVYTSRIVHGEFEYGGNVIAWMPLPEPYEERKDDE